MLVVPKPVAPCVPGEPISQVNIRYSVRKDGVELTVCSRYVANQVASNNGGGEVDAVRGENDGAASHEYFVETITRSSGSC